ncbi:hypothetical protein K438DRAFT_1982049 [Mycena galopus ATCC 62051]|nr:hypothetical protein K438DRAFT_1982049 [Mycena galopus ATCC 62051]
MPFAVISENLTASTFPCARPLRSRHIVENILHVDQPILGKEIIDSEYNTNTSTITDVPPTVAIKAVVKNHTEVPQTAKINWSETKSGIGTWNTTGGVEIGTKVTFSAGAPVIFKTEIETDAKFAYYLQFGGTATAMQTGKIEQPVTVANGKQCTVLVTVNIAKLTVPFDFKTKVAYMGKLRLTE